LNILQTVNVSYAENYLLFILLEHPEELVPNSHIKKEFFLCRYANFYIEVYQNSRRLQDVRGETVS